MHVALTKWKLKTYFTLKDLAPYKICNKKAAEVANTLSRHAFMTSSNKTYTVDPIAFIDRCIDKLSAISSSTRLDIMEEINLTLPLHTKALLDAIEAIKRAKDQGCHVYWSS
jgi:hypothetical protein